MKQSEKNFRKEVAGKRCDFRPMTNSQEIRLCMFGELVKECYKTERDNLVIVKEIPAGSTMTYVVGTRGDILYEQYDEPAVEPSWLKLPRKIAQIDEARGGRDGER